MESEAHVGVATIIQNLPVLGTPEPGPDDPISRVLPRRDGFGGRAIPADARVGETESQVPSERVHMPEETLITHLPRVHFPDPCALHMPGQRLAAQRGTMRIDQRDSLLDHWRGVLESYSGSLQNGGGAVTGGAE